MQPLVSILCSGGDVRRPGQINSEMHAQEFHLHLHSSAIDVNRGVHGQITSEVDHQFIGFLNIQIQVFFTAPSAKSLASAP